MADVDFERVDKEYTAGKPVVWHFDLHVDDGELMVVVGPSGCGKSTLLRLLAGLESVTHGCLRIAGRVVNELTPQERNVAMVFQDYALYPHRTVRGNLEFPLRMRRLGRDEMRKRVEWAAGLLGLAAALDRLPKELSGGERQRVAMGRALVREPSVFLLDEPLSNLDAKLRTEVRAEIADLQRRTRTTMLYVTHDQIEAMTLGHRIAVLDRGRLQQVGTPREVYERPANLFVAGFIGNPPMSLFPTRISVEAGRVLMSVGRQRVPLDGTEGEALAALSGRALHAGIRAEALSLGGVDRDPGTLEARIDHVESLGHETLASVSCGTPPEATRLIARVAAMPEFSPGETVRLSVDPRGVYLFDEDGAAIGVAAPRTTRTA
jgi:multiple sugar transport system ATP-binding protein